MKKIVLTLLFSFCLFYGNSQTSSFSMDQAIDYALKNSRSSVNASNDVKIAHAKKWETIATGLPQINSFIEYNNNIKQPVSLVPAEFFGGNSGEFAELSFGTKQTIDGSVTLSQLLFDGSYSVGLASIKLYMEIAYNVKIKTDQEVKKSIIAAYGNALVSQESVKILERNLSNVKSNLEEINKIYNSGFTELENVEHDNVSVDYTPAMFKAHILMLSQRLLLELEELLQ